MARKLIVEIIGDSSSLEKAFARSSKSASKFNRDVTRGSVVTRKAFTGMGAAASALGVTVGAGAIVAGIKGAVNAASDLNEEVNKSTVVFGESGEELVRWSKTTANAIGLSQRAALEGAGAFGGMFKAIGLGESQSARMSKRLVVLAADMASMNNQSPEEMLLKLRSGLAGEAEPLRRFSVFIDEASVKAEAYRTGIARVGAELTQQQKIQARYSLILRQTSFQQGDFARTAEGWANVQRRIRGLVEDTAARIGTKYLPALADAGDRLADWLADSENQERVQRALTDALGKTTAVIRGTVGVLSAMRDILQPLVGLLGGTESAVKRLFAAFAAFKTLQIISSLSGIATQTQLIGTNAQTSTKKVGRLRGGLVGLGKLGAVAIAIDLVVNKDDRESLINLAKWVGEGGPLKGPLDRLEEALGGRPADRGRRVTPVPGAIPAEIRDKITMRRLAEARELGGGGGGGAGGAGGLTANQRIARRNEWWDAVIGRRLDRVQDIRSLRGQLAELREVARLIQARIALTKDVTRRLNLQDRLLEVQREARGVIEAIRERTAQIREEQKALAEQRAEQAKLARQRRQFGALGLGPGGEDPIPGVQALRRRFERVREAVRGTALMTKKMQRLFAGIRKTLSGELGKLEPEVAAKIEEILAGIDRKLEEHGKKRGTRTRFRVADPEQILGGLGLSPEQIRLASARISALGPGGRVPIGGAGAFGQSLGAATAVNIYGDVVTQDSAKFVRDMQKKAARTRAQRRGVQPGVALGGA